MDYLPYPRNMGNKGSHALKLQQHLYDQMSSQTDFCDVTLLVGDVVSRYSVMFIFIYNCISCVSVGWLTSWFIGFSLGQATDFKIGICYFCAKRIVLGSRSKDWLARSQDNVSEWSNMLHQ